MLVYNYVLEEGKKIVKNGDNSFNKIEIDPEEIMTFNIYIWNNFTI